MNFDEIPMPSSDSDDNDGQCPSPDSNTVLPILPTRRSVAVKCPERCAVCRDQSTGHHYGAATCNRCKVFFRRYASAGKEVDCLKSGTCFELTKRQFLMCRPCRYKRCIAAGMSPLALTKSRIDPTTNELVQKYVSGQKQQEHLQLPSPTRLSPTIEDRIELVIRSLVHVEDQHDRVRRSTYCPRSNSNLGLEDILSTPNSFGMNYKDMPGWPLPDVNSGDNLPPQMDEYIRNCKPFPSIDLTNMADNDKEWLYVDMIYTIDYVRTFPVFEKLKHTDKINLLRYVTVLATSLTEVFFAYDNGADHLLFPDGRMPFRKHRVAKPEAIPYMQRLGMDRVQYLFLKAIIACDPTCTDMSHEGRLLLRDEREKYAQGLMAYLLAKHGSKKAPVMFMSAITMIATMKQRLTQLRNMTTYLIAVRVKRLTKLGQEVDSISF